MTLLTNLTIATAYFFHARKGDSRLFGCGLSESSGGFSFRDRRGRESVERASVGEAKRADGRRDVVVAFNSGLVSISLERENRARSKVSPDAASDCAYHSRESDVNSVKVQRVLAKREDRRVSRATGRYRRRRRRRRRRRAGLCELIPKARAASFFLFRGEPT